MNDLDDAFEKEDRWAFGPAELHGRPSRMCEDDEFVIGLRDELHKFGKNNPSFIAVAFSYNDAKRICHALNTMDRLADIAAEGVRITPLRFRHELRALMTKHEISPSDMAVRVNASRPTIEGWLSGTSSPVEPLRRKILTEVRKAFGK